MLKKSYFIIHLLLFITITGFFYHCSQPGQKISVVEMYPEGRVPLTTNLTLSFNENIVAPDSLNKDVRYPIITITPGIPGRLKWIEPNKLRFFPNVPLSPSTEYTLTLNSDLLSTPTKSLGGTTKFKFYTERLKIKDARLNISAPDPRTTTVTITATVEFNYPVKSSDFNTYTKIVLEDGRQVSFQLRPPKREGTIIAFRSRPIDLPKKNQSVKLIIDKALKPAGGNLGLIEDYITHAEIESTMPLKINRVDSEVTGNAVALRIRFNQPVNSKFAADYIQVSPEVDFQIESRWQTLYLRGKFDFNSVYSVTIMRGLTGEKKGIIKKEYTTQVRTGNMLPSVQIVSDGQYLSLKGQLNVAVETINVGKYVVEVYKVYSNNLVHFLHSNFGALRAGRYYYNNTGLSNYGNLLFEREVDVEYQKNKPRLSTISLKDYDQQNRQGIFYLSVRDAESRWRHDSRWILATDLGIQAKRNDNTLWVFVNSLDNLNPYADAAVTLLSKNNQVIARGFTDQDGLAVLDQLNWDAVELEPFVITVENKSDFSYLKFDHCKINTADFDVGGRPYLKSGYEAYLYSDRGVYRPGEKAHLVALVRESNLLLPSEFPVKLEILDPTNKLFNAYRSTLSQSASSEFEIAFPNYAKTGKYTARLVFADDQELERINFNVEEFIPDRIKVVITTDKETYTTGDTVKITSQGIMLFGPPASGRKGEGSLTLQDYLFKPPKYASFKFGDPEKKFSRLELKLGSVTLDNAGQHVFRLSLPDGLLPPSALKGVIEVTIIDHGGRAVSNYHDIDIHPYPVYIGLKRKQETGYAEIGKPFAFDLITVNPAGEPVATDSLIVELYRITYQTVLNYVNKRYRYVSEKQKTLVESIPINSTGEPQSISFTPDTYGQYQVVVKHPASSATTSLQFYASGWGYAPWAMSKPERLEIEFDQPVYSVGETANLLVKAPFAGQLLLTVEKEAVMEFHTYRLTSNTATIKLPVKESFSPNAYVVASLIRTNKNVERHAPVRAFGAGPLIINNKRHHLSLRIEAPEKIRPKAQLPITIQVANVTNETYVTVAAVDEGILQLTNFETPDPFYAFYAKKRLGVSSYDIYQYLFPEIETIPPSSSPSGDFIEIVRKRRLTPMDTRRVKPVSLWSGIVKLDQNGKATIKLDVPEFNGNLRLMATAFGGPDFGANRQPVLVQEPIVLLPTFPRFLAPGDRCTVPVSVYNYLDNAETIKITLTATGAINDSDTRQLVLAVGEEGSVYFNLTVPPEKMGEITLRLSAQGGGNTVTSETKLPVRPVSPYLTETDQFTITAGDSLKFTLPGNWMVGSDEHTITVSALPMVQFSESLRYLLRYPYGCVEQITSRLLPLLYFRDLAKVTEPYLFKDKSADYYIEEGLQELFFLQNSDGSFAYWPGYQTLNLWSSIYATHFLVEADKAGYPVRSKSLKSALKFLKKVAKGKSITERKSRRGKARPSRRSLSEARQLQTQVYANYVLALAGKPEKSTLLFLKNNKLDQMLLVSRYQLAGAFALIGDTKTTYSIIPVRHTPIDEKVESGGNFNSTVRNTAIILDILATIAPKHSVIPKYMDELTQKIRIGRWRNTQENAFALMALGKIYRAAGDANYTGWVTADSDTLMHFGSDSKSFTGKDLAGKTIVVKIQGTGSCYVYWRSEGIKLKTFFKEYDQGVRVSRRYLDRNGKVVNLANVRQGDLIVAGISMRAINQSLDNVVVADLLPAGFEIENTRLESRATIPWIRKNHQPDYVDLRDDRLLLFTRLGSNRNVDYYYALRAVTQGTFTIPPVVAEAMYDPAQRSVKSGGVLTIRPAP